MGGLESHNEYWMETDLCARFNLGDVRPLESSQSDAPDLHDAGCRGRGISRRATAARDFAALGIADSPNQSV
jgi:hypothetical protein